MVSFAPLLQLPNFNKTFEIEFDSSKVGIGVVFMQELKLISYFSKNLRGVTFDFSTHELELYALIRALVNWKHYLWPMEFIISID